MPRAEGNLLDDELLRAFGLLDERLEGLRGHL